MNLIAQRQGQQERHEHHERRVNLHERARHCNEHDRRQQKGFRAVDIRLHPVNRQIGNTCVDQIIGQTQCHAKNQHHATYQLRRQ